MNQLRQFNGDFETKKQLITFIHDYIQSETIKRVYERKDVSGIADAKELIDGAFNALEEMYGLKEKPPVLINEAK